MYTLGIIFFEMVQPFSTLMERTSTIMELKKTGKVPNLKEFKGSKNVIKIIEWLMNSNPNLRPSAEDLLNSELMPVKMEHEHLKNLFSRKISDLYLEREFSVSKQIEKNEYIENLKNIFKIHGGISFDVSIFLPNSEQVLSNQNTNTTMMLKSVRKKNKKKKLINK